MPSRSASQRRRSPRTRAFPPASQSLLRAIGKKAQDTRWWHVAELGGAVQLAGNVEDRERKRPIVCVTLPKRSTASLVDMNALVDAVAEHAGVVLVDHGDPIDQLNKRLPKGLGVHGGAMRIWFPFAHRGPQSSRHPRLTVREGDDGCAAIEWACEQLEGYRSEQIPPLKKGERVSAVIEHIDSVGVRCALRDGRTGCADRLHITRISDLPPQRVLRPEQTVIAQVADPKAKPVRLSLLDEEPDPWQRVVEEYVPGRVIACRIAKLQSFGAFGELLPGICGLIPISQISEEWVTDPGERLQPGQPVAVRVLKIKPDVREIDLTMRGLSVEDLPAQALSLHPDGPPWLDAVTALPSGQDSEASESEEIASTPAESEADTASSGVDSEDRHLDDHPPADSIEAERVQADPPKADAKASRPAVPLEEGRAAPASGEAKLAAGSSSESESLKDLVERLLAEVAKQRSTLEREHKEGEALLARLPGEMAQLQQVHGEADVLAKRIDRELRQARERVAQITDDRGLPAAFAALQKSNDGLRRQAAVAERAREEAIDHAAKQAERASGEQRRREQAERRISLLQRLHPNVGEGDLFLAECMEAWERATEPGDRKRYSWRAPILDDGFLSTLAKMRRDRERIVFYCALAACDRLHEVSGASLHPLREGKGPTAPQKRRQDGALAWRCSISKGAGAVRLHYWKLRDGTVELTAVGRHDEMI